MGNVPLELRIGCDVGGVYDIVGVVCWCWDGFGCGGFSGGGMWDEMNVDG